MSNAHLDSVTATFVEAYQITFYPYVHTRRKMFQQLMEEV